MKTAVIYARYSSDSQTEQSIEGQLRVCEEYAKTHDILILDTYIDRAMTGTNDNRPDFQRMIKDSYRKEWDYVLVYKIDRFSRNKYEMGQHKKTLKDSVPYGYKNENKKAVIVPEQAKVVRYIFKQYSIGVYVKDIIASLAEKGIYYYGKPFVKNTVYKILKNERYSGIYRYNGEVFDNIYPQIVPQEIYEKVRAKVEENHYGKRSVQTVYLLRHKVKCGYCGQSVNAGTGTSHTGEIKRYYKCNGRKHGGKCKKAPIRKDLLENLVMDSIINELGKPEIMNGIVSGLLSLQDRQIRENTALDAFIRERKRTETALNNIISAIERGITSNTTNKRLHELEEQQDKLDRQIIIEKSKVVIKVTEKEIQEFYVQALRSEPQMLINTLVKEIVLYDDKIEIYFNSPLKVSPDNSQGFSFVKISYRTSQWCEYRQMTMDIEMKI